MIMKALCPARQTSGRTKEGELRSIPLVTGGDGPADPPPGGPGGLPEALLEHELARALHRAAQRRPQLAEQVRLLLDLLRAERIDLAGGKVELRSHPGEGARLRISVPADLGGGSR
jgi:hypothetical protein